MQVLKWIISLFPCFNSHRLPYKKTNEIYFSFTVKVVSIRRSGPQLRKKGSLMTQLFMNELTGEPSRIQWDHVSYFHLSLKKALVSVYITVVSLSRKRINFLPALVRSLCVGRYRTMNS